MSAPELIVDVSDLVGHPETTKAVSGVHDVSLRLGDVTIKGPMQVELALSMPKAPVCREDCKGLCPICGTDLNEDPCDGHGEESDSPFAVLKDLFES